MGFMKEQSMRRRPSRRGGRPSITKTDQMRLEWYGDEALSMAKKASGEALGQAAKLVGVKVQKAALEVSRTSRWRQAARKGGYFSYKGIDTRPGAISRTITSGKFSTRDLFVGGYVGITSLWWIIERGTSRSIPRPFFKKGVKAALPAVHTLLAVDIERRFQREAERRRLAA